MRAHARSFSVAEVIFCVSLIVKQMSQRYFGNLPAGPVLSLVPHLT
jgi:hypothetical protein